MPRQPPVDLDDLTRTRDAGMDMLPSGTLVAGRYRIEEIAGIGGMGIVYRALDQELDTEVALKVLRQDRELDGQTLDRFRRELLLARKVTHPHVIRLHDLGQDGQLLFITMDFVRGRTLRELLADGPMELEQALTMARQLASALAEAHRQGVIHRDLKPGNILIDPDGRALITDFGVARSLADQQVTRIGQVVGTPAYLAPEQIRGEAVDGRADLFALGLVLCEALSGRRIEGDTTLDELLGQRASGHTPDPDRMIKGLPGWLNQVLRRCLAPKPDQRFASAEELLAALSGRRVRRLRFGPAALAVGLVLVSGLALLLWTRAPVAPPAVESGVIGPIAFLPLVNATERAHLAWAGRSLAETLSAGLAEAPEFQVVDNLRLLRLLDDLDLDPAAMDDRSQRRLLELLELSGLVSGHIYSLDQGFRIELRLHEPGRPEPGRIDLEVRGDSPLAGSAALLELLAGRLAVDAPTLPPAPFSDSPEALARYDAALALISRDRWTEAIDPLTEAVEHDPGFAAAWSRLAQVLDVTGRYDEAIDSARTAVELLAGHGGRISFEANARLAALGGELERAADIWRGLLAQYPADAEARLELSELLMALGELDAAERELNALVGLDPQQSRAWLLLGQIAILSGDPRRAIEEPLTRAVLIENRLGNLQRRGDIANAIGIAHQRMGELARASIQFEEAVRLRTEAGDQRGVAGTLANLAHLALIEGRFDEARDRLGAALQAREQLGDQAGMADLYNELGVLEEETGNYRQALEHYREALRLRELMGLTRDLADSYNNIAFVNFMLGELAGARQFNRAALDQLDREASPSSRIMALETRGYLSIAAGDWDDATRSFLESLDLSRTAERPFSVAVAQAGLGTVARHQGRLSAAFNAYSEASDAMLELGDMRSHTAFQLHLVEVELLAGRETAAGERLDQLKPEIKRRSYLGHLADWHRLRGLLAIRAQQPELARSELASSRQYAERAGNRTQEYQAEALLASLSDQGFDEELLRRIERLGHRMLTLETIWLAASTADRIGTADQATALARRGLRPPQSVSPWVHNWQLHWLAEAGRQEPSRARAELSTLISGLPESWQSDFVLRLPEELRDVEVPAISQGN